MKTKLIIASCLVAAVTFVLIYSSCKKKTDDTTPTATCSDGIQNQGETGIDCGGPCAACPVANTLCSGNGSSSYLPLTINNSWTLKDSIYGYNFYQTVVGTDVLSNSLTYFKMKFGSKYDYYRVAANGDIYGWFSDNSNVLFAGERMVIPSSHAPGQWWKDPYASPDSFVVNSINATLASSNGCAYTGLLEVYEYNFGILVYKSYYKKGLGRVQITDTGGNVQYLTSVILK